MPSPDDPRLTPPAGPGRRGQVALTRLALRSVPDSDGEQVTQALYGETLRVFEARAGFAEVQLERDRYVGYARLDGIREAVLAPTHQVCVLRTHAYSAPGVKAPGPLALPMGACLTASEDRENGFVRCEAAGWVPAGHLRSLSAPDNDPAAIAERFLGVPYLWGGRDSAGLDCTGLTVAAFGACGVTLPRDSDMQFAWAGTAIEDWNAPGALRRGDLVFWNGHVGIMLDAARFLHANAHHMAVAAEPLSGAIERIARLYGEPVGARRIDIEKARQERPAWLRSQSA